MKFLLAPLLAIGAVLALTTDPPVAELSNLTATAILGWYAWHTATRTIPQLVEMFRHELATERSQHQNDREAFLNQATEERDRRHDDHTALLQAIHDLTTLVNHLNDRAFVNPVSYISTSPSKGAP
ncbi:MAG TPA: hypothetical protein VGI75_06510 [Pirellulales bacterium]